MTPIDNVVNTIKLNYHGGRLFMFIYHFLSPNVGKQPSSGHPGGADGAHRFGSLPFKNTALIDLLQAKEEKWIVDLISAQLCLWFPLQSALWPSLTFR